MLPNFATANLCRLSQTARKPKGKGSVFFKQQLTLTNAKGKRFYLQQGKLDKVTALHWAEKAEKELKQNGAKVKLDIYNGGHGFAMPNVFQSIKTGLKWLLSKEK